MTPIPVSGHAPHTSPTPRLRNGILDDMPDQSAIAAPPSPVDVERLRAWGDFHRWFVAEARILGLASTMLVVTPGGLLHRLRHGWRHSSPGQESRIAGWPVTIRRTGRDRDADLLFVADDGAIHPLVSATPAATPGPPVITLSPAMSGLDHTGRRRWTDGLTLGENLAPALADLLARHHATVR
jgi:hypothetical protein